MKGKKRKKNIVASFTNQIKGAVCDFHRHLAVLH